MLTTLISSLLPRLSSSVSSSLITCSNTDMFKRALAHQSNATPIRSSDRRKLVKDVLARYSFLSDEASEEELRELGKLIVPEGVRSAGIETSGGIEGCLYLSPDGGDPLWMSFGRQSKELIPTLYLLSLSLPRPPLPLIKLHNPLPPPLFTGAPLFIGAVRNLAQPWLLPDVAEGEIVAFVTAPEGDKSDQVTYVGVGRMVAKGGMAGALERRVQALKSDTDVDEGRFCDILCIINDHLWESGSKPTLETFTLPPPRKPLVAPAQPTKSSRPSSPPRDDTPDVSSLDINAKPSTSTSASTSETAPASASSSSAPLAPSEISTLLNLALHQALSTLDPSSMPMPASTLYSAHILPSRPAYIPRNKRDDVVVGKSEWKKVSKWMKEVSKDGLIKVKEVKGEMTVFSFDHNHASIDGHKPHLTIAEDDARSAKKAAREAASGDGMVESAKGKGKEIAIEELWKPSGFAMSFWEACGIEASLLHPSSRLKPTFETYITQHNLVDPRNQRMVRLDDLLAVAIRAKGAEKMGREEILSRLKSGASWSVSIGGQVKKGALQPINLSVKTRQGRKVVTIITGVEAFGVNATEFAEELRRVCAGSASTQPLQGASPKLNLQEILVQGNQVKIVTEALMEKGVPRRYIKEGEGDKKKK